MKKIIALIMTFVVLFCTCCLNASGASSNVPHWYGDVDFDSKVTISDATTIQEYIAQRTELSKLDIEMADVNIDNVVSILDATAIQLYLADIDVPDSRIYDTYYRFLEIKNLATDYDNGYSLDDHKNFVLKAGVPVTFTVYDYHYEGSFKSYDKTCPLRYEFYVNGEIVSTDNEPYYANSLTYTFDEVGTYTVKVIAYNVYDEYDTFSWSYSVVENDGDDSFAITGLSQSSHHFDNQNNSTVYAHANNGSKPYEFRFVSDDLAIDTEYSQNNALDLGKLPLGNYSIEVFAKDANGTEVSRTFEIEVGENLIG